MKTDQPTGIGSTTRRLPGGAKRAKRISATNDSVIDEDLVRQLRPLARALLRQARRELAQRSLKAGATPKEAA